MIERRHRHQEFVKFLADIVADIPAEDRVKVHLVMDNYTNDVKVHLVMDNYTNDKTAAVKRRPTKHQRFIVNFYIDEWVVAIPGRAALHRYHRKAN